MRLDGGRSGPPIRMSISAGVTYCVPVIHWTFEIVGRGGMRASGLKSLSWLRTSDSPVPKMLMRAISDGPVKPRMLPEGVMMASLNRRVSRMSLAFTAAISRIDGME